MAAPDRRDGDRRGQEGGESRAAPAAARDVRIGPAANARGGGVDRRRNHSGCRPFRRAGSQRRVLLHTVSNCDAASTATPPHRPAGACRSPWHRLAGRDEEKADSPRLHRFGRRPGDGADLSSRENRGPGLDWHGRCTSFRDVGRPHRPAPHFQGGASDFLRACGRLAPDPHSHGRMLLPGPRPHFFMRLCMLHRHFST